MAASTDRRMPGPREQPSRRSQPLTVGERADGGVMLTCDFFRADILHRRARPELAEPAETSHRRPGQISARPSTPAPGHRSTGRIADPIGLHSCADLAMSNHMLIAIASAHTRTQPPALRPSTAPRKAPHGRAERRLRNTRVDGGQPRTVMSAPAAAPGRCGHRVQPAGAGSLRGRRESMVPGGANLGRGGLGLVSWIGRRVGGLPAPRAVCPAAADPGAPAPAVA